MPSLPRDDPYINVGQGYARLPGAGHEALHPELGDIDPEDYPAIHRMHILADVAPYPSEYQKASSTVRHQARDNPDLLTEYERISEQVRKIKDSTVQVAQRHLNASVDTIQGTVKRADAAGVELATCIFPFPSSLSPTVSCIGSAPTRRLGFFVLVLQPLRRLVRTSSGSGTRRRQNGWRELVDDGPSGDLDADLRIALLALCVGGDRRLAADFLRQSAVQRLKSIGLAEEPDKPASIPSLALWYRKLRCTSAEALLKGESDAALTMARALPRRPSGKQKQGRAASKP